MIQPTLTAYDWTHPEGVPVALSATSINKSAILLLDTFFQIVIWRGTVFDNWIAKGYDKDEQYAPLKRMLDASEADGLVRFKQAASNGR